MDSDIDRPPCRFCHGHRVTGWGRRYNLSSIKQRWYCKRCGRTFTHDDGFLWKPSYRHGDRSLSASISEAARSLMRWIICGRLMVSCLTVEQFIDWIQDYSTRLHGFLSIFKPKLRGSIHADEVIVKVKGGMSYSWGAIDKRTRYKISGPLTLTRSYRLGARPLYEKLKDRCEGLPPRIVTDKLGHYRRAFNKYFYHTGVKMIHGVPIAVGNTVSGTTTP